MTPGEFIAKWRASELKERSAAPEHFIDLCRLLDEPTPAETDPTGEQYCFQRGARKDTGGDGWADVWKRHCFAWEYKGKHADLDGAFNQLRQYALALENPPLLIVSDMARFRIRTNWTNSVSLTHEVTLDDLSDAGVRDKLKWAMSDPTAATRREPPSAPIRCGARCGSRAFAACFGPATCAASGTPEPVPEGRTGTFLRNLPRGLLKKHYIERCHYAHSTKNFR